MSSNFVTSKCSDYGLIKNKQYQIIQEVQSGYVIDVNGTADFFYKHWFN